MRAWDMLHRESNVLRMSSFGRREVQLAFVLSVAAVADPGDDANAIDAVRNRSLTFVGFVEALARAAEMASLPKQKDLDTWAKNRKVELKEGEHMGVFDYLSEVRLVPTKPSAVPYDTGL